MFTMIPLDNCGTMPSKHKLTELKNLIFYYAYSFCVCTQRKQSLTWPALALCTHKVLLPSLSSKRFTMYFPISPVFRAAIPYSLSVHKCIFFTFCTQILHQLSYKITHLLLVVFDLGVIVTTT